MPMFSNAPRRSFPCVVGTILFLAGCSPEPTSQAESDGSPQAAASVPTAPTATRAPQSASSAAPVSAADPKLAVEGEGLRWFLQPSGSARPIPFGRPREEVLLSLERVRGPADKGTNQDCGAGPVQYASWADGLSLVFQNERFVGWGLDNRAAGALSTAAGIGPGSTRAELEAAYDATISQTSLGTEFSGGELQGVLDGPSAKARITDMWAGISCVAR